MTNATGTTDAAGTAGAGTRIGELAVESLAGFADAVARIPQEYWERPSNLAGWTVRELVGHATGSATKVVTLVEGGELWAGPSEPADWWYPDPANRLRELLARLRAALPGADFGAPRPSPQGEAPLGQALRFPIADLALHGWDLYRSQGELTELPDSLLQFCQELVGSLPEDALRRPGAFGPAQPAPADATPTTRLLAHLGRSVDLAA